MSIYLTTRLTTIGPDVVDLAEGGVLILFANGAPPELAEVSVLHETQEEPAMESPKIGSVLRIGALQTLITAVGETAWAKVRDIGHVVISFNGAHQAERPGEICAGTINTQDLVAALSVNQTLTIED